jgi:hypothetical protein
MHVVCSLNGIHHNFWAASKRQKQRNENNNYFFHKAMFYCMFAVFMKKVGVLDTHFIKT